MKTEHRTKTLTLALATAACMLGGCQFISFAVASFAPRPKVKAVYEFPTDAKVLVVPDAQFHHLSDPTVPELLAEKINRKLIDKDMVAATTPHRLVEMHQIRLDREHRAAHGTPAPLSTLAAKFDVDRVLYVDIRQFRLRDHPSDPIWRAKFTTRVWVIDAEGDRMWPTDRRDGHELTVETTPTPNDSTTFSITLTEDLTDQMADKIVKLFYTHREGS